MAVFVAVGPARAADPVEEVGRVLKAHPELVIEALRQRPQEALAIIETAARERQADAEKKRVEEERKNPLKPVIQPGRATLGKADAPVTVVEYSDFFCHFCAAGAKTVKEFLAKYPDKVKLVFKHFATNRLSRQAALYFEALYRMNPELAWKYHDALFEKAEELAQKGEEGLKELAASLGADKAALEKGAADKALDDLIQKDVEEARAFQFRGTPAFVVNGLSVRGAAPIEVFEQTMDLSLGKGAPAPAK